MKIECPSTCWLAGCLVAFTGLLLFCAVARGFSGFHYKMAAVPAVQRCSVKGSTSGANNPLPVRTCWRRRSLPVVVLPLPLPPAAAQVAVALHLIATFHLVLPRSHLQVSRCVSLHQRASATDKIKVTCKRKK